MKIKKYFIFIGVLFIIGFTLSQRLGSEPIENLDIQSGVGYDLIKSTDGEYEYSVPASFYIFNYNGNVSSKVYTGVATTLSGTREERQRKLNKKFIIGFEKIYVISEEAARNGINGIIDILYKSQWVNDNGFMMVCKGKAKDILEDKIEGYPSAADYLEGMAYSTKTYDFFSKEYSLLDVVQTLDAEGKNTVLPYFEIKEGQPEITGMAIFNKDKMVYKIGVEDMQLMNILRNKKGSGIIDLQKNYKNYIGFDTNSKRKVKCIKEGEKYKFTINLSLSGNVITNELYPDLKDNPDIQSKFEKEMAAYVKKKCELFIGKMKSEYKMDMINLSQAAIAKYGRDTGTDWNKVIPESDIEVNVKVKVDQHLRGDF